MGGETISSMRCRASRKGLSPRGRGNPSTGGSAGTAFGSIPAWAGKPTNSRSWSAAGTVYPRVGGETHPDSPAKPRGRGLSPRGRGNLRDRSQRRDRAGSIPAWAGKPTTACGKFGPIRVYPRVGGETRQPRVIQEVTDGLSPRGRGNLDIYPVQAVRSRSIPAWAGKPPTPGSGPCPKRVYPRVGGETKGITDATLTAAGLSPRGRGNLTDAKIGPANARSIPAWAGKPPARRCRAA